jgi:ABC-type uncharacterized transport system permease subunit
MILLRPISKSYSILSWKTIRIKFRFKVCFGIVLVVKCKISLILNNVDSVKDQVKNEK